MPNIFNIPFIYSIYIYIIFLKWLNTDKNRLQYLCSTYIITFIVEWALLLTLSHYYCYTYIFQLQKSNLSIGWDPFEKKGGKSLFLTASFIARIFVALKGHWQRKISTFYIKVFDLNIQNAVVWRYENAEMLQKWWPWRHVLVNTWRNSYFLLLSTLPMTDFQKIFHAVDIAIKQQQYCKTVRPQPNSDHFTQHMTS